MASENETVADIVAKMRECLAQARTLLKVCTWDEDINQAGVDSLLAEIDAVLTAPSLPKSAEKANTTKKVDTK